MADKNAAPDSLNRGLSKRHVTMIAIVERLEQGCSWEPETQSV